MTRTSSRSFLQRPLPALLLFSFVAALFALPLATHAATTLSKPPNKLGLVGYWSFAEGTGTKATDFSGNHNTGTLTNGPTWANGKRGKALSFDGSGDVVTVNSTLGNFGTSDFSVTGWYKQTADAYIISKRATCDHGSFWDIGTNPLEIDIDQDGAGTNYLALVDPTSSNDGNWHHFAVTRSGTAVSLYRDGTSVASGNSAAPTNLSNPTTLSIGGGNPCGGDFNGTIDEVRNL